MTCTQTIVKENGLYIFSRFSFKTQDENIIICRLQF